MGVVQAAAGPDPDGRSGDAAARQQVVSDIVDVFAELNGRLRQHYVERSAEFGLSATDAAAVQRLREPTPMRALAARLGCDPSNVTSIVDRLHRRGLARRTPDPVDRRITRLVLTTEGERMQAALDARLLDAPPVVAGLDLDQQRTLRELLRTAAASPPGA